MKAPDILTMAAAHMAARAATYDQPDGERSMGRAVGALNSVLGRRALSESEGWLFMQLLKDVRDRTSPTPHADSLEDCVAYAALKAEARLAEGALMPAEEAATVDWSRAPEWATFIAMDDEYESDDKGTVVSDAYWYRARPTWNAAERSFRAGETAEFPELAFADPSVYSGLRVGALLERP